MRLTKKNIYLFAIGIIALALWGLGKILDQRAEAYVEGLYPRDKNGIIKGLESIVIKRQHSAAALLLLHGFGSSPDVFDAMIEAAKNRKIDIYAPLLPYHGHDLQTFADLNNEKVIQFVAADIQRLAKQYKRVTVLGFSYSGAVLIELFKRELIPSDVQVILYAPAIYIKSNTAEGDLLLSTYSLWREYCNYAALGCNARSYASGDANARKFLMNEKTFGYVVTPAVKQLYELDRFNRDYLVKIKPQFNLIIARDDNQVSYDDIAKACSAIQNCKLYAFSAGRHYLLLSQYKKQFNELVMRIVDRKY